MLPIFNDYRKMLKDFNIDLSEYDENKLWIDNLIIKGFDKQGKERKILRLKVNDNLEYEFKYYTKTTKKNGTQIIKPKNEELETYEETYKRLEKQIKEKVLESIELLKIKIPYYYKNNYKIVLPTSMGKDSKLVEYLYNKCLDIPKEIIFNNTTLDSSDVYKEVKNRKDIDIVTVKNNDGTYKSFYNMIKQYGFPSRFSRWCCSIFKEGGTMQYMENLDKICMIMGMRNEESSTRSNYGFMWRNIQWGKKKWLGILPIRKWSELELWLYTIHNNIPVNIKYKKGYHRVGCHIACPFYSKSTWILDKYWYKNQYDRFHKELSNDFKKEEKWCRLNCTEKEYHLNWNGGQVRENPTDEVIDEFMRYKGFTDRKIAEQYFEKKCMNCGKNVYKKDEIAMNLKLFGRNINKFKCKKCLMKELNWSKEDWNNQVNRFKDQGCSLF